MTTDHRVFAAAKRLAPRGSLIRFGLAGGFNSTVFFGAWTVSMWLLPSTDIRLLWGVLWGLTGIAAHFVHRIFTFDDHKPVAWTLPTSIPVYIGSMVGSSLTIGWLSNQFPASIYWMGVANLLAWGVVIWFIMRTLVFQYSDVKEHGSPTHQAE
jgi:hypothetical protein